MAHVAADRLDLVRYGARGTTVGIEDLLRRVPEVAGIARVEAESFFEETPRRYLGPAEWPGLARHCTGRLAGDPGLAGIVVTHGSAFLEETAYFLTLTVKSDRPVVLTASQRPLESLGSDAEANLLDAIRVAAAPQARGRGVLVVMNGGIHAAREATKASTFRLEAFPPGELGFLGYADADGQVVFYRSVERRHTTATEFDPAGLDVLPRVEILAVHAGADGALVEPALEHGAAGLVIAAAGAGSMPPAFLEAAARAAQRGVPVVVSSRVGHGRVIERGWMGALGLVCADNLTPQKARVLLALGLTRTRDRQALQRMFDVY
jgi:L-asparaginase